MTLTQPDFYEANLALLKKNYPKVRELLRTSGIEPAGEITFAANGQPNLSMKDSAGNDVSLHFNDNPAAEGEQFLGAVPADTTGVVTIVGFGLGYSPLALISQRPGLRHLAVFEPNVGIFLQAMRAMDLSPLLADPRFLLGIGSEERAGEVLEPASKALQLENIYNLQHLPSFSLDLAQYSRIQDEVYQHCSSFNIEGATVSHMGKDFLENRLRHLTSMHHDRLLMELAEKFAGLPVILVAAGPSLDKNVHLLKEAKGKALIIAADSALPAMVANGVMPDLMGTIDPLELIFEKVAGVVPKVHDVGLICMSWASSKMAKIFPSNQIFWGFAAKPIESWMSSLYGNSMQFAGAGSVAHLNLISALIMKCSPLVFVGQDLSFSPSHSHSANTVLQTNDLVSSLLANKDDIVWLDGIHGGKVLSNRGMNEHKRFFEMVIKDQPGHYINATEGGCHIEGTEVMPLRQVLDQYCAKEIGIDTIMAPSITQVQDRSKRVAHLLAEFGKATRLCRLLTKQLGKADQVLRSLLQWLHKEKGQRRSYRDFASLPASIQKKIVELDKISKQLDDAHSIWPLLQEVTIAGLRDSEKQKHDIEMMASDPKRYMEWLNQNFQRIVEINRVRRQVLPLFTNQIDIAAAFLPAEGKLLAAIDEKGAADAGAFLKLARLYYETGNLNRARPWIAKLSQMLPESAEVNFLEGWVSAHYTEYAKAEEYFAKAKAKDPAYGVKIEAFRQSQGDAYIKYAAHFQLTDKATARRLLAKGLRYAPAHAATHQHLIELCDQALMEIKKYQEEQANDKVRGIVEGWLADLAANDHLATVIGPERASQFYHCQGLILGQENDYDQAIAAVTNALALTPNDPALHIALTDMYFSLEDYPQGITHLNAAVNLDSSLAVYWEQIGDSLVEASSYEDAVASYERCFTILPDRLHLLKKIGDCYMAMDQLEAAREAYQQLKTKIQASDLATDKVQ